MRLLAKTLLVIALVTAPMIAEAQKNEIFGFKVVEAPINAPLRPQHLVSQKIYFDVDYYYSNDFGQAIFNVSVISSDDKESAYFGTGQADLRPGRNTARVSIMSLDERAPAKWRTKKVGFIMRSMDSYIDFLKKEFPYEREWVNAIAGVQWSVQDVSSGIKDITGIVAHGIDLSNISTAQDIMLQGCRQGEGGSWFGTIRLYQDNQLAAESNLRGCTGAIHRNYVAERRDAAAKAIATERAKNTDQGISNIRGIDKDIVRELNAIVAEQKAFPACNDGCKDFEVFCSSAERSIGRADKANGVSAGRFIGLGWLRYGAPSLIGGLILRGSPSKWNEDRQVVHLRKVDGVWEKHSTGMGYERCPQ